MPTTPETELVKLLDEAYAMEKQVEKMLVSMIKTTDDPTLSSDMETHKEETEAHAERVRECIEAHGEKPSKVKEGAALSIAFMKLPLDAGRREKGMRNARDGFASEHLEIAMYRLIEELATRANDPQSKAVARQNAEDEERMAKRINEHWSKFIALDFKAQEVA